jgi:uroporphyrin-III C-methyltransferase/precorrin-2 dehydrogenase/sirohydrochlorin ferrochelatase
MTASSSTPTLAPSIGPEASPGDEIRGRVVLVGAGPGDPELLTLKAVKALQVADVVVYDHLVSTAVLDFAPVAAQKIYAGKRRNEHSMRQERINQLLVDLARQGLQVVRLKGGDPFIFGRGGEEMQALAAAGIAFEVVPGITAANAASCYAGIPLTHRDFAQSVVFVTGHLQDGTANLDWPGLVKPHQTVVIYMGLGGAASICEQLLAHGAPHDRPVAVVQMASTARQRVLVSTLASLPGDLRTDPFESPSLLVIGDVAQLAQQLAWFSPPG